MDDTFTVHYQIQTGDPEQGFISRSVTIQASEIPTDYDLADWLSEVIMEDLTEHVFPAPIGSSRQGFLTWAQGQLDARERLADVQAYDA